VVHLRGVAHNGTPGATVFQLPAGYRPTNSKLIPCRLDGSVGSLLIDSSGNVGDANAAGGALAFGVDGITFLAEQ
jgi:hypothetical protein